MSKRWLAILLFISLSFNVAVLGSFIYFRVFVHPSCPPPHQSEHRGGGMPAEPRFMTQDPEIDKLRERFNNTKLNLMQELSKDPLDEAKIASIIDSSLIAQNQLERTLGGNILAYRKTMSAEEAREHFQRRIKHIQDRSQQFQKIRNRRKP
ncbi:MAG: hypothetical protein PHY48_06170 [Candidatus Cloacimonetes bacterium]|nr:hypothetical protein [Candidatus Cloacimonadota bacterium]